MRASAIKTEYSRKNECPIEGHPFLPNKKARNPACPSFEDVAILGSKTESVKTFSWLQEEASINIANEIGNCLLRPGKDKGTSYLDKMIHLPATRPYVLSQEDVWSFNEYSYN